MQDNQEFNNRNIRKIGQYLGFYDKNSPYADSSGNVYIHRIVTSKKLGRPIHPKEYVHHIDGDKFNNSQDNLMVFASCSAHTAFHNGDAIIQLPDGTFDVVLKPRNTCSICGAPIYRTSKMCPLCSSRMREKVNWPSDDTLSTLVSTYSLLSLEKLFGVSSNAIKHRCQHQKILIPKGKKKTY